MQLEQKIAGALPKLPIELKRWSRNAFSKSVRIAALSMPRGNAKSFLCGRIAALFLDPEMKLGKKGPNEVVIVSGSIEQSRVVFGFIKEAIAGHEKEYRIAESIQRLRIEHKASGNTVRAISSSGKRAMGLAQFNVLIGDEPAAWETRNGALLFDALRQSLGKRPEQKLLLIGTLSPSEPGSWWPELIKAGTNTKTGTYVTCISADIEEPWDSWDTVRKVNPMFRLNKELARTVKQEHEEAKANPSLKASFEAYRLNRLVETREEMLCRVEDWKTVESRPVPPRMGKPIVGLDLGAHRSWSAIWCLWPNGRSECYALCGGIPDLAAREKQDAVPKGLYQKLWEEGTLLIDEGVRHARPATLLDKMTLLGIEPEVIYCDRFLLNQLLDVLPTSWQVIERKTRWSEATEDITGLRRLIADGPLSIVPECRTLARYSLSQAIVIEDEGNLRVSKRRKWKSRDDVAICATLAGGALARQLQRKPVETSVRLLVC
ncbi:MAG: hypothetical protein F4X63_09245 [Nitrospira sp. SB0662_bin_26]|nr:hypothetical protein [Nitrospira sp. SB0662_bin_26]